MSRIVEDTLPRVSVCEWNFFGERKNFPVAGPRLPGSMDNSVRVQTTLSTAVGNEFHNLDINRFFPMDVDTVKQFAVSRNMSSEHLRQYAQTLGLVIKCSGRRGSIPGLPRGTCDRLTFGIKKGAMDVLKSKYAHVKSSLFKFGVSFKTGLFNASEL